MFQTKLYTELASIYDLMYQHFINYDEEFNFYSGLLEQNNCSSVLEIGCGSGHLAKRLSSQFQYCGMDISADMLSLAHQNAPNCHFIEADMTHFEITQKFDAVIITARSISYLLENNDIINAFRCIKKVLNTNGLLVFDFIEATSFFSKIDPHHTLIHTVEEDNRKYLRESIYSKNLLSGLTWNWYSKYSVDNTFIAEDNATLRAFLPDEFRILLDFCDFDVIEQIIKPTYAFDTYVFVAQTK